MQEKLIKIAKSVEALTLHLEHCSIFYTAETPSEELSQDPVDCLLSALEYLQTADESQIDDCMLWLDHTHTAFINKTEPSLWERLAEIIRQDLMIQLHDLAWSELSPEIQQRLFMGLRNVHLSCTIKAKEKVVNAYFQLEDIHDDSLVDSINQRIQLLTEDNNPAPNELDIGAEKFNDLQNCLKEFQHSLEKGLLNLNNFNLSEQLRLSKDTLRFNKKCLTENQYNNVNDKLSDIEKDIGTFNNSGKEIEEMASTIQNFLSQPQNPSELNDSETKISVFYENLRTKQPHFAAQHTKALELSKDIKAQLKIVTEEINKAISESRQPEYTDSKQHNAILS